MEFDRPKYEDIDRLPLVLLIPKNTKKILDIGCNQGGFGLSLKNLMDIEVWGVEPDEQAATVAKERLDNVIVDFFHSGNPIPDNYFDVITFNDSLEHMPDPASALELCKKKLKTGGRIHCCVPNMRHIDNLEHLFLEKDWRYEEFGIRDKTHLRFFTLKSIVRLFENLELNVVQTMFINEKWWDSKKLLRRLLYRFFPELMSDTKHIQIVVIAEPKK
ncbi:class I SAM-dependent methyltransferase [Ferrovum myxofaciens]|jgi:SAM-dependent methyltransferase|uniref:Ubiquinone biosynthesis O-methyltransferase n=1 Tax=Ferrovum myxofaciens TaxID=416213 RepID=A0A859AAV3_9PROT|nr:class I SAM-dependent methyltransferase [Ferrovum myxofaciens]KXW57718.1 ubiquinone biosynthesis O-methyltransferase [Ferrovum myxofaciens]QKE39173.1 MAG: class I SAM-dependent methyltransferase [Ferrovum myxofaciens]QKE41712.1 MAG: class I SAM-dependent methyltransferase [Ferrovum myxofaciens]QWY74420.1 MAG: class I SAM-dependent methyltransferase [Ferrovum myxofaciens]